MTLQIDYQMPKESKLTPPIKKKQIQEVRNKYEPLLKKEKFLPPKQELRRDWSANSPIPKRKKITLARSLLDPGKRDLSVQMEKKRKNPASAQTLASKENSIKQIAMVKKEAFLKKISDRDSPHNILLSSKKTPQSPKSLRSSKTSSSRVETETKKISMLKRELSEKRPQLPPVTDQPPHLKKSSPSPYPNQEKISAKNFSLLNAEKSPQQRSLPATQTAERKTDLNPSLSDIAPELVMASAVKMPLQIDSPAPEKIVSSPMDKEKEHDLRTKTYHDNSGKETTRLLPTAKRKVRQDQMESLPSPRGKKNITSRLASDTQKMASVPSPSNEIASTARKNYLDHRTVTERTSFLEKMPEMESSALSARKTLQSPETMVSPKPADSRTKIKMEKVTSRRKVVDIIGKQVKLLPVVDRTPQPKKTISLFDPAQAKNSLTRLSVLAGEKEQQTPKTKITQTAKRISGSQSPALPSAIDTRQKTGLSAYYQSRSAPPVGKSALSTIPKQKSPVEEKKIDKQINYQKDSNTKLAMLTPGQMPKTNIYDVVSGAFKKKKLDKKIYDSFIIPPKKDKATLTSFLNNHFLNRNPVKEILVTSKGTVWAGIEGGILKYDGLRWDFFQSTGKLPGEVVYALAEAADGSFWIGTEKGLTQLDRWGNPTSPSTRLNGTIFDIRIDQKGTVWAGTDSGLFRYNGSQWEKVQLPEEVSGENVHTIVEDTKGRIWIGTEKGLSVYDGKKWTHFDTTDGLIHNNVYSLAVDTRGNLWCGTEEGVSRFNGKSWQSYTKADGLADNMVYTVKADSKGNVWFGTGAGVSKFNNYRFFNYDRKNGLLGWNVHSIAIANNGEYWFGTDRGVSKMLETN